MQPCILQDKDAILPALGGDYPGETLLVVVSTDEPGAKVVASRILEQLESSESLKLSCVFEVSSRELKVPSHHNKKPVDKVVQEIADRVTEISMARLRQRQASAN